MRSILNFCRILYPPMMMILFPLSFYSLCWVFMT